MTQMDPRGSLRFFTCCVAVGVSLARPAGAQSVSAPLPAEAQLSSDDETDNNGSDFARPLNLFQLMYLYRTAPAATTEGGTIREVATKTVNLRVDGRVDLAPRWVLATRTDLPFVAKDGFTTDTSGSNYAAGIGDAGSQAALIYSLNERWKAGVGVRLIAPTGDGVLGSGKWRVMPILGVRYALPELSPGSFLEPLVRYDTSFAGISTKRNIGNLQMAPTLNIEFPEHWFVTLFPSPDIRLNLNRPTAGQTGRLFLPFDARIGRKVGENLSISLEVGAPIIKQYPVYSFKTQLRVNLLF